MSRLARREASWGLLFVTPWILGFLAFTLLPMLATLLFTFTNINLEQREPLRFIGLDNYSRLLGDGQAWDALWVTLKFTALALPVAVFLPLAVGLLLSHRNLRGAGLFRALFFLPFVVPFVAGVLIWQTMLNPETGWIDVFLKAIGIANPPDWLRDQSWVYAGLVFMGLWGIGGGIVIYLAGLATVPAVCSLSPTTSMYGIFCSWASRILNPIFSWRSSTSTRRPAAASASRTDRA
jgi:multiple sugar transport system permease protein